MRRASRGRETLRAVVAALGLLLPGRLATATVGPVDPVGEAADAITAMELDRARERLAPLDAGAATIPAVAFQLGRLALALGDCEDAVRRLAPQAVQALPDAGAMLNVARGCARAMAATALVEDGPHGVLIRFQDDADRSLAVLIGETIDKQREVLARDLGVVMPRPARVDVVRDQFSLAAMTGLPHSAAQTTGTVAIAKFGRVIALSPRAPTLGYAWRDTLAHEYTHLALTRGSLDRAPLWLQEGVAKREETRWRPPTPSDDAVSPDVLASTGLARGLGRPLDGIGPSIALLPTAKEAAVVYAEVTSFVRFISGDRAGAPGAPTDATILPRLVQAYAKGLDTDAALAEVTGRDLKAWNTVWRAWVMTRTGRLPPSLGLDTPDADRGTATGRHGPAKDERANGRSFRLGELLLGRGFAKLARGHFDPLVIKVSGDALVAARAARARLDADDVAGARAIVVDTTAYGDLGTLWGVRGDAIRAAAGGKITPEATAAYAAGVDHDPFDIDVACGWADSTAPEEPSGVLARGICATARARAWPRIGED